MDFIAGPWFWGRWCLVISWCDLWVGLYWDKEERVMYGSLCPGVIVGCSTGPKEDWHAKWKGG